MTDVPIRHSLEDGRSVVIRVLLINHTARVSGGERSLLDLLAGMDPHVQVLVACPKGDLTVRLTNCGRVWTPITGTDGSLRLHPIRSPRALLDLARTARELRTIARKHRIDVFHANSIRAGLAAIGARLLGGPPVIVHVRDVLPPSVIAALTRRVIAHSTTFAIANSAHTAVAFGARPERARIIPSPIDVGHFRRHDTVSRERARHQLELIPNRLHLAVVAQLTPWKAQDDAIRILAALTARPRPRLLIIGGVLFDAAGTRYDNRAYAMGLRTLAADLGVADDVAFLGNREDVPLLLRAIDVLLVPSWEEPFGRSVIEGMASGLPVIATANGGPAEIISDRIDGRLLPPRRPTIWARALDELLADGDERARMGARANATARSKYGHYTHARAVEAVYRDVLQPPRGQRAQTGRSECR